MMNKHLFLVDLLIRVEIQITCMVLIQKAIQVGFLKFKEQNSFFLKLIHFQNFIIEIIKKFCKSINEIVKKDITQFMDQRV